MQLDLPHLTFSSPSRHTTPHTPKGVVVWQWNAEPCRTFAEPQVWQVWQSARHDQAAPPHPAPTPRRDGNASRA
jgi:hypothetical protein